MDYKLVTQLQKLNESSDFSNLRKALGICECGKAMYFNRLHQRMACSECECDLKDREMTPEEKKKQDDWWEAEHDHMPA